MHSTSKEMEQTSKILLNFLNATHNHLLNNNLKLSTEKLKLSDGRILTSLILKEIIEGSQWKREAAELGRRVKPSPTVSRHDHPFAVSREPLPRENPKKSSKSRVQRRGRKTHGEPAKLDLPGPKPLDPARRALFTTPGDIDESLRKSAQIPDPAKHQPRRTPLLRAQLRRRTVSPQRYD